MSDAVEDDDLRTAEPPMRKITVKEFVDPVQLKKDLSYTLVDLSGAMVEHASLFAHYGVLAAKASRQVDNMKMLLENAKALVYRKVRDQLVSEGEKVTEALLEKEVARHPKVRAVQLALNEAKQVEAIAKTAAESFRHRRDMLVQQGLISREEMKGEVSVSRRREAENEREQMQERVLQQIQRRRSGESED